MLMDTDFGLGSSRTVQKIWVVLKPLSTWQFVAAAIGTADRSHLPSPALSAVSPSLLSLAVVVRGYGDCSVVLALVWAKPEVVEWVSRAYFCQVRPMRMASPAQIHTVRTLPGCVCTWRNKMYRRESRMRILWNMSWTGRMGQVGFWLTGERPGSFPKGRKRVSMAHVLLTCLRAEAHLSKWY